MMLRQVSTGCLVFSLLFAGGCGSQARRGRHLDRAEDFFSRKQYEEAVIEYMNVLRLDPTNGVAIRGLGMAHAATGNLRASIPFMLTAAELYPDDLSLQVSAGGIYLMAGQVERARVAADRILDADPASLTGYLLLADTARTEPEVAAALARLEPLTATFGAEAGYHAALAELHLRLGDVSAAEAALKEALRINPDLARVHLALGQVHRMAGDPERAAAEFQKGADLAPDDPVVQVRFAQFKLQTGDREGARQVLSAMVAGRPESGRARLELAKLDVEDRRFDDALAHLDSILKTTPEHVEAILLRSRVWLAVNRTEDALGALENLVKVLPRDPRVLFELGLARFTNRDPVKALEALDQALVIAPGFLPARLLRAETQIRRGNTDEVLTDLRDILQKHPDNEKAHLLLGAAYQALGQHANATAVYRGLINLVPREAHAHFLLATSLHAEGAEDEARAELDKARELDPGHQPALNLLTEMDVRANNHDAALDRIRKQLDQAPGNARLLYLQGIVQLNRREQEAAEQSLRQAIEAAPDMLDAYMMLGHLFAMTGRSKEALEKAKAAIAVEPRSISALMLAAVLESNAGNRTGSLDYYRQAVAINPGFFPALNNLAYLLAENERDLDQALEFGQRARQAAPDNPLVADTLGWIAYKKGNYTWAYALIREGADKLPEYPEVYYHLGMVQAMLGREADAVASLGKALAGGPAYPGADEATALLAVLKIAPEEAGPEDRKAVDAMLAIRPDHPVALLRLASIEAREGSIASAITRGEGVMKAYPNYLPAIVQMALLREQQGEYDKALALARDAHAKSGEDPEVKALLGWMAYRTGQHSWAAGLLRGAAEARPQGARVQYRAGMAELALGKTLSARAFLDKALHLDTGFPGADDARQTLAMLDLADSDTSTDKDLQAAQLALSTDPDDPATLYAVALLLRRRNEEQTFIKAAERLLEQFPAFVPMARDLAAVYLRRREKLERAYALAAQARRELPADPDVGLILGKLAHLRGENDYAVTLLTQAVDAVPEDAEALYMLGLSHDAAGRRAEAVEFLTRALKLAPEAPLAAKAREVMVKEDSR